MNHDALDNIFSRAYNLSVKKNKDYGDEPILKFGKKGVVIRLSDKMLRLENLVMNNSGKRDVSDETVKDTCLDIINYAAYIIMLQEGNYTEEDEE